MQADNDSLEKKLTVVFGVVAALAILFKLHLNGYGTVDLLVNGRVKVYRQGGAKVYQLARDGLMLFYRKRGLGAARKQA